MIIRWASRRPSWTLPLRCAVLLVLSMAAGVAPAAAETPPSFQALVDATPENGTLRPDPGVYAGPVRITRPITIDGGGKVVVDNGGKGTVIEITSSNVQVQGLTVRNSGGHHTQLDAGFKLNGDFIIVKDNVVENCLFGIDVAMGKFNIVRRNEITTIANEHIGMRGDAIRLWYAHDAKVQDNVIRDSRDVVVWYSENSTVTGNHISNGRYGIHFMYSHGAEVAENHLYRNIVGIFSMYSNAIHLRRNTVIESNGPAGIGIGFKETSGATVEDNLLIGNARGLYVDKSPDTPEENHFVRNKLAFNGTAIEFNANWKDNIFEHNDFTGNHGQVVVSGGGGATASVWRDNYWDVYEGFDRDGDGIGDTPFELYAYADRLWMDVPDAAFFRGSPVLELLDFLERLAPFSEPQLILSDESPRLKRVAAGPQRTATQ